MVGPLAFIGPKHREAAERHAVNEIMQDAKESGLDSEDLDHLQRLHHDWQHHKDPWPIFHWARDTIEVYVAFGPTQVFNDQGEWL